MNQQTITQGNSAVVITEQDGRYSARLYVNARDGLAHASATPLDWKGKTLAGAKRWAAKMLTPATPLRALAA